MWVKIYTIYTTAFIIKRRLDYCPASKEDSQKKRAVEGAAATTAHPAGSTSAVLLGKIFQRL